MAVKEKAPVDQEVPEVEQGAPVEEKTGSKKGLIIGIVLVVLVAGFWLRHRSAQKVSANAPVQETHVKGIMPLEGFVVNLTDPDSRAFLRVGITLGLATVIAAKGEHGGKGAEQSVAPIRDAILGVLTSQTSEELLTTKGKEKLKADLLTALQSRVPALEVKEVYFTEFLVQR